MKYSDIINALPRSYGDYLSTEEEWIDLLNRAIQRVCLATRRFNTVVTNTPVNGQSVVKGSEATQTISFTNYWGDLWTQDIVEVYDQLYTLHSSGVFVLSDDPTNPTYGKDKIIKYTKDNNVFYEILKFEKYNILDHSEYRRVPTDRLYLGNPTLNGYTTIVYDVADPQQRKDLVIDYVPKVYDLTDECLVDNALYNLLTLELRRSFILYVDDVVSDYNQLGVIGDQIDQEIIRCKNGVINTYMPAQRLSSTQPRFVY